MTDIRSKAGKVNAKNIDDLTFDIVKDRYGSGYKVKLKWKYDIRQYPGVILFKIYKANLAKTKLQKDYVINQKALERISGNDSHTNVLYNKSLFSQNSQVKFENSNSLQHNKKEGNLSSYVYNSFNVIRATNIKTEYSYEDKNVKFGETYSYYITAICKDGTETMPVPLLINVESLKHPSPPYLFEVSETDKGILLIIGNNQDVNVSKFKIYRREDSEKDFILLTDIENNSEAVHYLDASILPKKQYVYRVYSEDLFGALSLDGIEKIGSFRFNPPWTNLEYQPSIIIDGDDVGGVRIRVKNERPDKVNSIRIERRDDWRFETSFNIKTFNGLPWVNNHFFEDGIVEFLDKTILTKKPFSYKITSFNKSGFPVSYFISNPMIPGETKVLSNNQLPNTTAPKLLYFDTDVVNSKQDSVHLKCNWKIDGDWYYLLLKTGDRSIKIDNVHKNAFIDGFRQGVRYSLSVEVYGFDGLQSDEYRGIIVNI